LRRGRRPPGPSRAPPAASTSGSRSTSARAPPGSSRPVRRPADSRMRRYVLIRTLSILPTLLGVSLAVFLVIRLIPGTIVEQMIGTEGTYSAETMRALRTFFGLDQRTQVRYVRWLGQLLRGDLGTSWRTGLPVREMIWSRLAVTAELTGGAMLVALAVGVPLGILSARRESTAVDHAVRLLSL